MELLKELDEKDIGVEENNAEKFKLRKAARSIVLNDEGKTALLNVAKHNYHKLAGGGFEEDEDILRALHREVKEEVGCEVEILNEVGIIIEYRDKIEVLQISYCYVSKVLTNLQKQEFTKEELSQGFNLIWVDIDEAIKLIENDKPDNYEGKFIQKRDLILLNKAKDILNK